jgi:uncharacterized membrane protein HdeD (DUF308 family)
VFGVVSLVVGILLIRHPIGGVLAAALLVHRVWRVLLALVQLAAGVVLVSSPSISLATLALLVGISLIASGVTTFALGWLMHAVRRDTTPAAFGAGAPA